MHARVINELDLRRRRLVYKDCLVGGDVRLSRCLIEGTLWVLQATCKERTPKHEQEVGQDRPKHLRRCQAHSRGEYTVCTEVCTIRNWSVKSSQSMFRTAHEARRTLHEGGHTDDDFYGISEGGVQKPRHGLAQLE